MTAKMSARKKNSKGSEKKVGSIKNGGSEIQGDPMAVTWMQKYSPVMDKIWDKTPKHLRSALITVAVFLLGSAIRGEWLLVGIHILRQFGLYQPDENVPLSWDNITLESLGFKDLHYYILGACAVSYSMYFLIGGFIHWYFYVRQRDKAHEWKCQPDKFLPPDLERHEILIGSLSLLVTNTFSGIVSCYIANGGYSTIYYKLDEYGWLWYFLQWPVIYIYEDYLTYWMHRIYHWPWLYINFHKLHHKYKQPTAFSVTAIHPIEILSIQIGLCTPLFLFPLHWSSFYVINLYSYYHGIIDHSGVNFKSFWWQPWQPDAIFHDNHHQYFHVNFGFNMEVWDRIHGTYRQKDRIYKEDVFYGKGKSITEASEKELQEDLAERRSENPLAYRSNKLEFELEEQDLKKKKKKSQS